MNITIKTLSISTLILWITILLFSVSAVFSAISLDLGVGEPDMIPSSKGITFLLPFFINNNGYYEIEDFNLTTRITEPQGKTLDVTETIVPSIPQGSNITATHTVPIDLVDILEIDYMPLLFEDTSFNAEVFAAANFAKTIPVQFSMNMNIPWGAPLANFAIGKISLSPLNFTHTEVTVPVSFENHAIIDMQGIMKTEVYNDLEQLMVSGDKTIDTPSLKDFEDCFHLPLSNLETSRMTSGGKVHVTFMTSLFTVDWWEEYD